MENKLRGVYVVNEIGTLDPCSGAYRHIEIGIRELQKHFSIHPLLPRIPEDNQTTTQQEQKPCQNGSTRKTSSLKGSLTDLKIFMTASLKAVNTLRIILKGNFDFVYVRASFLDPLPLFLCAFKIPCFVESNGLLFEARKKYYPSLLTPLNRRIEKLVYSVAQHVFFIGTYGDYWKLQGNNWSNVENGVEVDFLTAFSGHEKQAANNKIHLTLIARLMAHHQPQVLAAAIKSVNLGAKSKLCLHLIGSGFDLLHRELEGHIEVLDHGFLSHHDLKKLLTQMHVGLVPGAPTYTSQMKLFDYGAAKCVVLAPKTYNLDYWFDESEVEFFKVDDSTSLAGALMRIIDELPDSLYKGECLHQRIASEFTWESIFLKKAKVIEKVLVA